MDLILSEADRPEQRREVRTFPCLVGKAEDCDLRLQDNRLSNHHAVILLDGERLRLMDLSSLNGTYVLQPEGATRGKPVVCPAVESVEGIPAPLLSSAPELRNGTTVAFGGLLYTCELRRAAGKPQDVESSGEAPPSPPITEQRSERNTQGSTGFRLAIKGGPESGRTVAVEKQSAILGSDSASADIVFSSNLVSRRHAKLMRNSKGQIVIEDLQSKNGTYVQGDRLTRPTVLRPGVEVSLGHGTVFHIEDHAARVHSRIERALLAGLVGCIIIAVGAVVLRSGRDESADDADQAPRETETKTTELDTPMPIDGTAAPPVASRSRNEQTLLNVESWLASGESWDKEQLVALQNQLRSVSEPAVGERKAALGDSIRRRMMSLQALEKAHAAVRAGDFDRALKSFEEAGEQDSANPWAVSGRNLIREARPLLSRVAVEAGYDSPDESRLGALVQEILQKDAEGPLSEALHGYLETRLGSIASSYLRRATGLRKRGKPVDALAAVRGGLNLMPWDEQGIQMLAALEKEAKPELESLLIRAYQLESKRDAESREHSATMYRRIMDVCSPGDWTARFYEKARTRVE